MDVDDGCLIAVASLIAGVGCLIEVGKEFVVFLLCDRIVLVIVALSTFHAEPHPHHRCCFYSIDRIFHAVFFFDQPTFIGGGVVSQKSRRHTLVDCRIRQQVTGQLFQRKLIERLVAVVSTDYPVSPRPHVARAIGMKDAGVAVACGIHPYDCHAFAKVR